MPKRLGGIIGCKYKTSLWHLNGFPYGGSVTLGQQYNIGEKPTVILYTIVLVDHVDLFEHSSSPSERNIK